MNGYNGNTLKPITWHTTKHGDRVFAAKVANGALHSGTIIKAGRNRVRVQFDDNGASYRPYDEVYPAREVFEGIKVGALRAKVEVQCSSNVNAFSARR